MGSWCHHIGQPRSRSGQTSHQVNLFCVLYLYVCVCVFVSHFIVFADHGVLVVIRTDTGRYQIDDKALARLGLHQVWTEIPKHFLFGTEIFLDTLFFMLNSVIKICELFLHFKLNQFPQGFEQEILALEAEEDGGKHLLQATHPPPHRPRHLLHHRRGRLQLCREPNRWTYPESWNGPFGLLYLWGKNKLNVYILAMFFQHQVCCRVIGLTPKLFFSRKSW